MDPRTGQDPVGARLMSLDVFRGATIASMLLVNNPGSWSAVYPPFLHAPWHGWTFTDVIFPFFLWIVGVAMTLSFAKRVDRGDDKRRLLRHTLRRAAIIFLIGIFMAAFPLFAISTLRIPGVLQRIAVCYLCAAAIFLATSIRGQIAWTGFLLLIYTLLMKLYPVPGFGAGILEKEGNFAQYIDNMILRGHMWSQTRIWDPEGIVSTLPAIATTLLGILTGHLLRKCQNPAVRTAWLFLCGNLLMFSGLLLDLYIPINKNLWTSSYALFMAGLASNVFAACYWIIDVQGWKRWAQPFAIYGMNAILVFALSGLVAKSAGLIRFSRMDGSRVSLSALIFETIYLPLASPINASLLFALTYVAVFYLVALFMYRKGWFLKV